jgi:hypothetical protein
LALAGAGVGASTAVAQPIDTMKLRDELMALEKGSWDFMRDQNIEAMRGFLGDDSLWIFSDGNRYNKRQGLEMMKDFKLLSLSIEPSYAVRMLTVDVATLLYRVAYTGTYKGGKPETVKALSSSVYVRRDGKWLSVLYQETPLK